MTRCNIESVTIDSQLTAPSLLVDRWNLVFNDVVSEVQGLILLASFYFHDFGFLTEACDSLRIQIHPHFLDHLSHRPLGFRLEYMGIN